MSLLSLNKDVLNIILEKCVDYSNWAEKMDMYSIPPALFKYISRFTLTCKRLNEIAQKFIHDRSYTFHIYQRSIKTPSIVDHCGKIYRPQHIGNNIWILSVKQSSGAFMYVDGEGYEYYLGSDRYFRENEICLKGQRGSITTIDIQVYSICFTVHYKAKFGEILLLTWYQTLACQIHHHIKMHWTEGDVWIGVINTDYSNIGYRYEICADHGGPIIKKESKYREISLYPLTSKVVTDIWDCPEVTF